MRKRKNIFLLIVLLGILIILYSTNVFAAENAKRAYTDGLYKMAAGKVTQTLCNIGNWGFWANYTGQTGHDPFTGSSGGYYPRGTAAAIYMDGIIWGGYLRGASNISLRVGGIGYRIGTDPGWILTPGDGTLDADYIPNGATAASANDDRARIYRIRSDWRTLSLAQVTKDAAEQNNISEAQVTAAQAQEVIDQYKADWLNWPVDLGAPYYDVNDNGEYDPVLDADGYADETAGDYPGIANADQVLWFVVNDLNPTKTIAHSGSPPMGLELQITLWGYNQPGAGLGQIVFKKYKIINYSGFYIDSMFVAQYSDPDLGNAGDDFVGCDIEKSLHFVYNGQPNDDDYTGFGLVPPAAGYDFFQGPWVKTDDNADTAVIDLKYNIGYKNLPMTSFGYFSAGAPIEDPDMGDYVEFTHSWYNMLNGFIPTTDLNDPTPYYVGSGPNAGQPSKFPLSGDPVTDPTGAEGDVDGQGDNFALGDRRMFACSGPFTMAPDEIQEVVVALVAETGSDYINSVAAMKEIDVLAQKLYDNLFLTVPKPPAGPKVEVANLDETIVLNWGSDLAAVAATEADNPLTGYNFEGYNVYQLPKASSTLAEGVRLATYDIPNGVTVITGPRFIPAYGQVVEVPVQFGGDLGLKRYFNITKNYITGDPLRQGTTYYFAVTAYNYNAEPKLIQDKALESGAVILSVTHQGPKPGDVYDSEVAELLDVTHDGPSDGQVQVRVVDPSVVNGHSYEVSFVLDSDTNSATYGEILWNLKDLDDNVFVLQNQSQVTTLADNNQLIADGLQVQVSGPPLSINAIYEADQDGNVLDPRVSIAIPGYAGASLGTTGYIVDNRANGVNLFGAFERDFDRFDYWGMDDLEINFNETSLTWDYSSEEVHYDSAAGEYYMAPFSMYRYNFTTGEKLRLFAGFWDLNDNGIWDLDTAVAAGPSTYGVPFYEPIYAWQGYDVDGNEISYDPANDAVYEADNWLGEPTTANTTWGSATGEFVYPWVTATYICMYADDATLPLGNKIIFRTNKPNTLNDTFTFIAPTTSSSLEQAKEDVKKVNVFPNPYYGASSLEPNRFERFVTFNHLPQKATVRIFNLAGVQVRKLEKDTPEQFFRWDLLNESGLPVASGLYVAYIDMPDLGKTKVLKLMVIQSDQVLEYY
jgi:type II secretory pathway pseudopilin PulG